MDETEDAPPAPSGRGGIVLAIVGFVVGIGAGVGIPMAMGATEEVEAPVADEATTADRAMLALEPFTLNLRGGEGRLLVLEVQLEVDASNLDDITGQTPKLRDATVFLASDYAASELEGLDGKLRLRDELLGRLNATLDGAAVQRVYFTHFLVQ